jgi:3-dehydroquinate synthase
MESSLINHREASAPSVIRRRSEGFDSLRYDGVEMTTIEVAVQPRPYEVRIESGLLDKAGETLRSQLPGGSRLFVVTVAPVRRKWAKKLMSSLRAAGFAADVIEMPEGERFKRLATVEDLAEKLVGLDADRNAVIVAFGGGVAGDVAGFLASLYMRGIDVVQVPTTVLAQVDAAIGGKTGVNLKAGKNLVGTFHQPRMVLIDPEVLSSLPDREYRAGLYEVLKCGVIGNAGLFREFEENREAIVKRDPTTVERLIVESVRLKAHVVSVDEKENGLRRVLNFGHTIGHALEAETGYRTLLHGEAVGWGMVAAAWIAGEVGKLDRDSARRIREATLALGRLPKVDVRGRSIVRRLQADKKTRNGRVHFVLPTEIGKVEVVSDVPEKVVLGAVAEVCGLSK